MAPMNSLKGDLHEIAATLRSLSRQIEGGLLVVGERLAGTLGTLDGLTRRFEALPRELEDDTLREAAEYFGSVSRDVARMAEALLEERASLSRLMALNQQMGGRIEGLRKTVRAIAMLAVNAQIEAAHIEVKGEDFSAFANEILRLTRTASTTTEGYAREHERLTGLLRDACERQARFAATHEGTLRLVAQQLEASLRAVEARRVEAARAAAEIGQRSKRISEEVGTAVMALQIGDITRQRLEHVGEALTMVSAGLEPVETGAPADAAWSSALAADQQMAVAAAVCRMQWAQTLQAAAEFEHEIARVVASLRGLAEEASTIVRFGSEAYGADDSRGGSFLEDLQANLRATGALVRDCQAARDGVDSVVAAVAVSLGELLDRLSSVRRIEVDMRLVGLNTALKCGRLGSTGRTLSVVAQELRGYANQTVQDADALMATLRDIGDAAKGFEKKRQGQDADRIASLERGMASALGPFEECGVRLGRALSTLSEQGRLVAQTLQETADGVTTQDAIGKALQAAGSRLASMMGAVAAADADAEVITERLRFFSKGRYTMASEREIHARFASDAPAAAIPAQAPSSAASAASSLEDVLF